MLRDTLSITAPNKHLCLLQSLVTHPSVSFRFGLADALKIKKRIGFYILHIIIEHSLHFSTEAWQRISVAVFCFHLKGTSIKNIWMEKIVRRSFYFTFTKKGSWSIFRQGKQEQPPPHHPNGKIPNHDMMDAFSHFVKFLFIVWNQFPHVSLKACWIPFTSNHMMYFQERYKSVAVWCQHHTDNEKKRTNLV